jgi:prophage regulatory protein
MTTERFLRIRQVRDITGLPQSSIYEAITKSEFPRQVRLGRQRVGWLESEIRAWQNARIAERDDAKFQQSASSVSFGCAVRTLKRMRDSSTSNGIGRESTRQAKRAAS